MKQLPGFLVPIDPIQFEFRLYLVEQSISVCTFHPSTAFGRCQNCDLFKFRRPLDACSNTERAVSFFMF